MAKWAEPRVGDLLAALHRIERVAASIAGDELARRHCAWNVSRAEEIVRLAQLSVSLVQEPLNNGK
jgi:hypothetical protein